MPHKTSCKYILLSTGSLWTKTSFYRFCTSTSMWNPLFWHLFFATLSFLHPHPQPKLFPPPVVGAPSSLLITLMVSSSSSVRGQNLQPRLLHDMRPPSFLMVAWESYTPSSHMTMSIYCVKLPGLGLNFPCAVLLALQIGSAVFLLHKADKLLARCNLQYMYV
jgi:hypothetical protein